jgi:TrmH family RNA methyltransferase
MQKEAHVAADRRRARRRFPVILYLDNVRSPYNVGAIIRTAESLGADGLMTGGNTPETNHPRLRRAAMNCERWLPLRTGTIEDAVNWSNGVPIALDTGGRPLSEVRFPDRGVLVLGNESAGIAPETRRRIKENGGYTVTIPTWGKKASLNVSVAAGIGLAAWVGQLRSSSRV